MKVIGSEGKQRVRDDVKFLPLGQIEEAIYNRRRQAGLPVFRDLSAFSQSLAKLADEYVERLSFAAEAALHAKSRQKRFREVARAAAKLQRALEALDRSEIANLGAQQREAFRKWEAALGGSQAGTTCWYVEDEAETAEVAGARDAGRMLACHDLVWLRDGAQLLTPIPQKGRKANTIEIQTAAKFVYLCHFSGWSPVQFGNSGTDKKNIDIQVSDAVLCLAAVFASCQRSGVSVTQFMTKAYSALKALRPGVEWDVWRKVGENDTGAHSEFECVTLEINLKKIKVRREERPAQPAFRRPTRSVK